MTPTQAASLQASGLINYLERNTASPEEREAATALEALLRDKADLERKLAPFANLATWIIENRTHRANPHDEFQVGDFPYSISMGDLLAALAQVERGE